MATVHDLTSAGFDPATAPTLRFVVELKEDVLFKAVVREEKKDGGDVDDARESLPEAQGDAWEDTKDWIRGYAPTATFAARAGYLFVTIPLNVDDGVGGEVDVLDLVEPFKEFKAFQVTKFTRARDFYYFPNGLDGPGYGKGQELGPMSAFVSKNRRKLAALNRYWSL
jgi:hypothetical protein